MKATHFMPTAHDHRADAEPPRLYARLVRTVQLLLGVEFVLNGLNWWVKLIDAYPSITDYAHKPPSDNVVGAMIKTGIMFHLVKGTELLAGIALLANRFVPLALVMVLPVTINVFIFDVFLASHLRAHIMGSGALFLSAFLMCAYLSYYRPMLDFRTDFDSVPTGDRAARRPQFSWLDPQASRISRGLMLVFAMASAVVGIVMVGWVLIMVAQHFSLISKTLV